MIEIIYKLIDIMKIFIDKLFNFQIEFTKGNYVPIGIVVIAFIFLVFAIYIIFKALGLTKESDD